MYLSGFVLRAWSRILLILVQILKLQYVHEPIQQLVCSPNNDLLAVVTEHTIHVCVLPDSSHLVQPDSGPIRPKSQIIGQTTHVLSQARITNALWHPLGVNGSCLVTVTEDVVVRLWELNLDNRWSAEEPSLAVDLRKLQFANTSEDDVQPDRIGKNRGFSTDVIGMEVASACFGSKGAEEEGAWSAMTLWVAMAEGDVYALCPLLPSKWQPPSTLIPSLTTSVAAKRDFVQVSKVSAGAKEICEQQYAWLKELDNDDPVMISGRSEFSDPIPVYRRPKTFNSIPLLQGPFSIIPGDVEDDLDLSDIAVVAPRLDAEGIYPDDDDESELLPGLTSAIVCLLTGSGRVYVCLDLDGVEGRWLPRKRSKSRLSQLDESIPELLVLEALETVDTSSLKQPLKVLPMFSADIHSRYAFFVTHDKGVSYLSTESLIEQLQGETEAEETSGLQLRIDSIMKGSHILREQILKFGKEGSKRDLSAPVIMQDSDLGYFLLTYCDGLPHAAVLDTPRDFEKGSGQDLGDSRRQREETPAHLLLTNPRPSFEPSKYLYQPSGIRAFIDTQVSSRYKHNLKDEIRLSAAALEIITDAHRLLSKETHAMKTGVSDLFTRCDEMLHELRNQIASVREIAEKVDHINGEDADTFDDDKARGSENLDERLQRAKDKYGELATRHDALKKRLALVGGRPLSEKEQGWVKEVDKLSKSLVSPEEIDEESEVLNGSKREYWQRFEEVRFK